MPTATQPAASGQERLATSEKCKPFLSASRAILTTGHSLTEFLDQQGLQPSRGATRRLATGGGLRLDGETVADPDQASAADSDGWLLSLGKKRHYRIVVQD